MKGTILDFSIQTNSGIISGEDQKRYTFFGNEWKENTTPLRGIQVDFDLNELGQAIGVYKALNSATQNITFDIENKDESQYQFYDWFIKCFKNFANFNGRARRKEFWFFRLTVAIMTILMLIIDEILGTEGILSSLFFITILLPDLAVSVRRLHDTGRSGWWFLIACFPIVGIILLIFWWATEGNSQTNLYGESPK